MRRPWLVTAIALTVFYSMTALVSSGCEPSYSLVLKPWPMWGWGFGGDEGDCYWDTEHPGVPRPWWLDAPTLIYASSEDSGGGNLGLFYMLGLLGAMLLWIVLAISALFRAAHNALKKS